MAVEGKDAMEPLTCDAACLGFKHEQHLNTSKQFFIHCFCHSLNLAFFVPRKY